MRLRWLTVVVGAMAMVASSMTSSAAATESVGAGLWSSTYTPNDTDCGAFTRDGNHFCNADDPGAVELGVKFTTSKAIRISGVRMYRVDPDSQAASLWAADGTLLATGSFSSPAEHAWRDVAFTSPVAIVPGQVYIASYHSPNAQYAFEYEYFTNSALTVGPITALQSVEGSRNGVYCYVGEPCNLFPVNSYRDLNYWVTPLWSYAFSGFFQPVDNLPTWNKAKAGSAIPVKFSLGGNQGLGILRSGYPKATTVTCPGSSTMVDSIEETVTAGSSALTYDATSDRYSYVWKTDKSWAGRCLQFELGLNDGTSHIFNVQFVR